MNSIRRHATPEPHTPIPSPTHTDRAVCRGVLRRRELEKKTGLSATTIYHLERCGEFPKHFMLTRKCAAWDVAEVEAWLTARKEGNVRGSPGPSPLSRTAR